MDQPSVQLVQTELAPLPNVRLKAQALKIRLPFSNASFTWNRPVAASVTLADGTEQTVPVVDVTRLAQVGLLVGGLVFILAFGLLMRLRR